MAKRNYISKRKDGKWLVSFPTGIRKENGKREYIYKYCETQKEAIEVLEQLQAEKQMGVCQGKSTIKTGDWINKWIEDTKAPKLAPATLTSYRNNFRLHIKPVIGEIVLRDLTSNNLQRMLDNIGGSTSTFVKNYNIVHGALEHAVNQGVLPRNPCKGVNHPKDDTEKMRVLTKEEQTAFINALEGEYYRPMLLTYLYTGMRMGEGVPLLWTDVDLEKRTIRVNKKAIVAHNYEKHEAKQEVQDFCKTKSSKRSIAITAGLVRILAEHKAEMQALAEELGEEWTEDRLVFPNTWGNIVHTRNLQKTTERIYKKAGIEGATMHTLRHTYATRCFEAGVDIKAISDQLGHAKVKTTYDTYVHLLDDKKIEEIDKLSEIDALLPTDEVTAVEGKVIDISDRIA